MGCSKEVCVIGIVSMFLIVIAYGFIQDPGCGQDCHKKVFKNFAFIALLVIGCIVKFSKPCGNSEDFQGNNSHMRQATIQNSQVNPGMHQVVSINNTPGERFVTLSPTENPFIIGNYWELPDRIKRDGPPKYDPPPDYNECQIYWQQSRQDSKF